MPGQAEAPPDGDPVVPEREVSAAQPAADQIDASFRDDDADRWNGVNQWDDSRWSRWGDRGDQSRGNEWNHHGLQWEAGATPAWERRQSWDATTAGTVGNTDRWSTGSDDPWSHGRDPWTAGALHEDRHQRGSGWPDHGRAPWADGRAGHPHGSDSGDHGSGSWGGSYGQDDNGIAWNGWSHYDGGGFQGKFDGQRGGYGGGRASEKLAVPSFTGEDSDDIGSSARSYLRQIEAWRRMTYLPPSQQGLVLYQNLGGKAWIAAEELSVPRLASDGGVGYFVSWVNARFLDLEVARIGKAFSDFFRRLKRRQGQTIREYNSEYDRLHARLREVGCSIPQECAAWLYIDRLQLEEAQELNLLASVGNEYNLLKLQQAAVLHDRGVAEGDGSDDDLPHGEEDIDLEDGVPEDVAVAYATYQSAEDRYKDQAKARGYQGDRTSNAAKDPPKKADLSREDKVKLMKSRSFCGSCGKKGHWHRDPECPNYHTSAQGASKNIKEIGVCHHVPAEVYSLRHEGASLLGITDTACAKAVAGTMWLQQYSDALKEINATPELVKEAEAFRFGTGKVHHSSFHVVLCFKLGTKVVEMKTSIINGDVPLLMSKPALAQLGMIYDVAENRADFTRVGLHQVDLVTTSSGHPAIPIVPAKPTLGSERLVVGETEVQSCPQYTAFALSMVGNASGSSSSTSSWGPKATTTQSTPSPTPSTSTTKAPPYKIFYDKKLSPEVRELLTQDRLCEVSFTSWWERTKISSDFWLEGEAMWYRIHVVPRRALCNPSTWKTQSTVQKSMLLQSIGDIRVTEGFCCRTGKPLEAAVDQWKHDQSDMACKQPAISKMTKTQLLEECNRLGLVVHRAWTCEELKATIMEHRMNDPTHKQANALKSVSSMTLADLRVKADSLGVAYSERTTKGNLIRLIRDAVSTPGSELMKIGKFKGYEFQEIPRSYGMWAAREVRMSQNPHVELIRYAKWWEAKEYEENYGSEGTLEANATVPYPADVASVAASSGTAPWDLVPDQQPSRKELDLPFDPRATKRGAPTGATNEMESEIDPTTLDEIKALETRLAILKQKAKAADLAQSEEAKDCEETTLHHDGFCEADERHLLPDQGRRHGLVHPPPLPEKLGFYEHGGTHFGNKPTEHERVCCGQDYDATTHGIFITTDEFERSGINNTPINYQCYRAGRHRDDPFTQAYNDKDFQPETLARLLNLLDYKPVRGARDGKFGGKTGDPVNYFTYGMFTHGGIVGVTTKTRECDNVVRYLNAYGKYHLGGAASWSSISLSRDVTTEVHHDYHNYKGTRNFTTSVGQDSGGGLWIEDRSVTENTLSGDVKWRRTSTGQWLPGRTYDTHHKFLEFDPFLKHATEPWTGSRWSVTYHTTRNLCKGGPEMLKFLKGCGFPLPRRQPLAASEERATRKPRASTRRSIFNNAAKIGVMMATLITAAGSYMSEHFAPKPDAEPIVIFEIGNTEATHEAASIGKDVFEPMSWERYRTPEGKESAFHIVNGGGPRELRLCLDSRPQECGEAVLDLARLQIEDGGTVVIHGPADDEILDLIDHDHFLKEAKRYQSNDEGRVFLVMFREKADTEPVSCRDRVHEIKMVSRDSGPQPSDEPMPMGAGGISFGANTPGAVATALRRLHQNLGHPRQEDLIRHLRLAGCDPSVLKAARSMKCQVCAANAGPKIARPSTLPPMADFNDTLGLDLFFCHDTDDVKHGFLSVVDYGTTYHLAVRVDGQSAEDIEAKFNEMWLLPFGPPKAVVIDLEGGLQSALGRLCDWHGIGVRSVAAQSHWQAGVVERQQAWWKHIWDKVSYQLSVTEDEVDLAVPIINGAKNDLRRRCGYSPSQWVFGKAPRVPEDIQDPDGGGHVLWDVSEDAKYQRQAAMRAAARVAFHQSQTDGRLRKAMLQRTRVASRPLDVGESVHFWHKPKNRRRGCWTGPAVIVGKEGGNYWLSKGGRCRLTSPEHVRPTTAEEVGALLTMKSTQREMERLLDHDPDGDEAYEDDEQEYLDDLLEDLSLPGDDDKAAELENMELDDEGIALDAFDDIAQEATELPRRRLKRKTAVAELNPDRHEAMMLKTQLTTRGLEKRKEKELKWTEIPPEVHDKFREAEKTQWDEHLSFDALEPLTTSESERIRREVPAERILRSRWAYKDKNWSRRREGEDVPWKCKSRLVIAGHTDPDLTDENLNLSTDAPTLSRSGLACMLQRTADGLEETDSWTLAAGDIRCAFLTGSYLDRELFMHQPKTGFPGMKPEQLVRIKKNVFGLATSPHTWWQDLQGGINEIEIEFPDTDYAGKYRFEQSAMDPCVFLLRRWNGESFEGTPVAYLGCHVDDLLVAGPRGLQQTIQRALAAKFEIQDWEMDEFEFLGSKIQVREHSINMTQEKYADTRLFYLDLPAGVSDDDMAPPELVSDNRSLVGALSWMSAQTRPDLTCCVSMAQQLQKSPTYGDLKFTNATAVKAHQFRERGLEFRGIPKDRMMIVVFHDAAWANVPEADPDEDYYVLSHDENQAGLQTEGPYASGVARKAKKGNSRVASQLGVLVTFVDRGALSGEPGHCNIADWKSRAGQRVCRSTFGAETQACAEGLETAQYLRSMYESLTKGYLVTVEAAELPILCLSDCRSLYDHLRRQGIPRVPSDKRLAVDLAALRQGLRLEKWCNELPIAWIPGSLQRGDVLTKPQNPSEWWDMIGAKLLLPLAIAKGGVLISNRKIRQKTSVKLDRIPTLDGILPYEYAVV
ncbi:RE2 [Symbiodinium sp. CCMP2592]|nr:RE2 [Symbiodinium sp. CCMP2592]